MQRGDMVRVSTKLGFVKCYFALMMSPYPEEVESNRFEQTDHFNTEDIGLVLDVILVENLSSKIPVMSGTYVELLSPRGKIGRMNSDNLEVIQSL